MDELNFLYAEYVRLNSLVDSYAASSFSDFQLLGVVGLMLAWEPFANRLINIRKNEKAETQIIFFGFAAITFVIAIIATRDLMKQSIIAFEITQIRHYEQAIRDLVTFELGNTFNGANEWKSWLINVHVPVSSHFRALLIALATLFPSIVLWLKDKRYTYYYLGVVALLSVIYIHAVLTLKNGVGL